MNYACQYQPETIPQLNKIYTYTGANDYKTTVYHNVTDIKSGYIEYYPKKRQIQDVFTQPNYVNNCQIDARLYQNPMGSIMPDYHRTLTKNNLQKPNQLTWISDTSEQREEIMSLQMRKMNRTMYETKW
jgi:hypothetical protein